MSKRDVSGHPRLFRSHPCASQVLALCEAGRIWSQPQSAWIECHRVDGWFYLAGSGCVESELLGALNSVAWVPIRGSDGFLRSRC